MSTKVHVVLENQNKWDELQEWKLGRTTPEIHRTRLRAAANVPRVIVADTAEGRVRETPRCTMEQIRIDTYALDTELSQWKAGLKTFTPRARSRSPRRDEIKADSTSSRRAEALGYVAAHTFIRSEAETRMKAMIDERDATIAKQAKIIADLEVGKGPIGPVLKAVFDNGLTPPDHWQDRMERPEMKTSVIQYIKDKHNLAYNLWSKMMFNT